MDHNDKLLKIYDKIMDQIAEAVHTADATLQPTLEEMIDNATDLAYQAKDISVKDAKEFSQYLKRDLEDVLQNIHQQGAELNQWLRFDYELVEDKFINIVSKAADKTWLTLNRFEQSKRMDVIYRTGEIISPGVIDCIGCSQAMQFKKSAHIPPCPKCHKTEFVRKPL